MESSVRSDHLENVRPVEWHRRVQRPALWGTPADITYGLGSWMPSFAEQGALVVADDMLKRLGGIKKEDFFPTLVGAQTWKGKLQALPYGTGSKGYYVRPEIVKRENVTKLPL